MQLARLNNNGEVNAIFSIIIPAYNVQDYISEAILSGLGKTFEVFEAIIAKEFAKK